MVDHGYMFDYYEPSGTPWTMSYDGTRHRLYEGGGATPDSSLKSVPYSAMDSNSYQSLLSLRSSTIPPKDVASLRAFSTTFSSSSSAVPSRLSTVSSTVPRGEPVLSAPLPIYSLHARRKRQSEFFQAEYLPVERWRAERRLAHWTPPSDQPYYEVEWLRVARGRTPAALIADGVVCLEDVSTRSDISGRTPTSTTDHESTAPRVDETSSDYESTTVLATTNAIEEEFAANVLALDRDVEEWDTTSSVLSPLSADLSSIDLATPARSTTGSSLDAWDCETQTGDDPATATPSKSVLRGVYDLLAAIFCQRRKRAEEVAVKNVEMKLDRGYSYD